MYPDFTFVQKAQQRVIGCRAAEGLVSQLQVPFEEEREGVQSSAQSAVMPTADLAASHQRLIAENEALKAEIAQLRQNAAEAEQRAHQTLHETESTLLGILNAVKESIWLFGLDGVALMGNETALARWGRPPETILGRDFREALPEDLANSRYARLREAASVGPIQFEDQRDGIIFEHMFYPVRDPDGCVGRVAAFSRDITQRKRAEQALRDSERIYRAIGESINFGVWICAPDGRNIYASESFLKLVGLTQEQCSNFGWGDVLHPDDAERTIAAWQDCVKSGGNWDIEHRFRGTDGQWHPVLARGVPVKNDQGEITCWAGINLDIGRLKQVENDLRKRESALAAADRQKSEFLAVLSHELRNPLTPILTSLSILDRVVPGGEHANRAKSVIERQVSQLTRLVDDLLDVTRMVSGKLRIEPCRFDLVSMLSRTADDYRSIFIGAGVDFLVDLCPGPVWVLGDETRLAQAAGNLLGNAAKFSDHGGQVQFELDLDVGAERAIIRVRDTGIGIARELLANVFEPFVQADRTLDRSRGGLGLGLALVKSVILLHDGTVEAHSDGPGTGAEFVVRVPIEAQRSLPLRERAVLPTRSKSWRVLVVEDNTDAVASIRTVLELGGHEVEVAYNGFEGIGKARTFKPEVVFCDIGLPGLNGYEVAKAFRADKGLRNTRLVALTGYAQVEDLAQAAEAGFDLHVAKPPSLESIESALEQLLSWQQ